MLTAHLHSTRAVATDAEGFVDVADVVGPYAWDVIHHAAEHFPCESCAEEGKSLFRFAHDLVNKKIGKPVKFQANFDTWVGRISAMTGKVATAAQIPPGIVRALAEATLAEGDPLQEVGKDVGNAIDHLNWALESLGSAAALCEGDRPVCKGADRDALERCISDLKSDPDVDNPFAVCVASVGCKLR